jgi:hypothetical protein
MPQNRFISPTASGRKAVPFAGRRLARTLAPPNSSVDLETLIPLASWKNHFVVLYFVIFPLELCETRGAFEL